MDNRKRRIRNDWPGYADFKKRPCQMPGNSLFKNQSVCSVFGPGRNWPHAVKANRSWELEDDAMGNNTCRNCRYFRTSDWSCRIAKEHFYVKKGSSCSRWQNLRPTCSNCKLWKPSGSILKIGRCDNRAQTARMHSCSNWKKLTWGWYGKRKTAYKKRVWHHNWIWVPAHGEC